MSNSQPPKLNYVKARQKSKTKNEPESQQKISFEADSSTDIFAHLNQDNLNYIKKQLKHKKSHKSETTKPQPTIEQKSQSQSQSIIHQQKVYEKYKNSDQVTERDSREEQTLRQTEVDDSMLSDYESANSKNLHPLSKANSQEPQKQIQQKEKQMTKYLGLQPPPLTYKKQSITSNQGDNMKHLQKSLEFQVIKKKQKKDLNKKNPFQQYELKSQASNNPIGNSTVSVENHLSQDLSMNLRPSQFIDRLQNYIEELNLTTEKFNQFHSHNHESVSAEQESRNFRKNTIYQNTQQQIQEKAFESQRTSFSKQYRHIPISRFPQSRISDQQNQIQYLLYDKNQNESIPNKHMIKNYKQPTKISLHQIENQNEKIEELQNQVHREKSYCMKLALELEKYKQNEEKYRKQIFLLNKSMEVLKIEVLDLREIYEKQVQKSTRIISYIQNQHFSRQKDRKNVRENYERQKKSQNNENYRSTGKKSSLKHRDLNFRQSRNEKQFQKMMRLSPNDQLYTDLNQSIFENLNEQFKKGKHLFHQQKRQRHPLIDVNLHYEGTQSGFKDESLEQELLEPRRFSRNKYENHNSKKPLNKFGNQKKVFEPSPQKSSSFKTYKKSDFKNDLIDIDENLIQESHKGNNRRKKFSHGQGQRVEKNEGSSLEKLKKEYQIFKAQTHLIRPEHKKIKSVNIANEHSPRQFSHVFVK